MSDAAIAEPLEVHRNTVSNGWRAYQAEGVRSIRFQTRGRKPGERSTLNPRQDAGSIPLKFCALDRQAVQALIRLRLNRTMPLRTVDETLKRWGFTPQKPLKRAYLPDEAYPAIAARAKREKAEIQFGLAH